MNALETLATERLNRAKAIRRKCLDCCMDQPVEVKECPITRCALWRYRMGREEQDELYAEAHKKRRKKKNEEAND